ncbi:mitogen-activated protein kinase 3-like [Macadamia integrifolia]|uniref:mitogen-activated protein kinase 3-like n=1 Tax=Macadamia integrifolia TaxID=60698 RepID=UPI001C4F83FA|nr:mitogen-activated protein kinase 3-like [Macadamia integrifolia]
MQEGAASAAANSQVPNASQNTNAVQVTNFSAIPTHGGLYTQYNIYGNLFEITSKYRPPIMLIGIGASGRVCSAFNSKTKEIVAIKKISNAFDNHKNAKRTLREIMLLQRFNHENIICIKDVIPPPVRSAFCDVYIATELMETDLHNVIYSNQELTEEHRQYILYQILRGLKYIHSANVIHRDLKPSNILLNSNCDVKICDFGLARITSENEFMTEYVVTRWYRAPELLLKSSDYTAAVDVWSVGCIFMELVNRKTLFQGKDYMHQMNLLIELLGTPNESELGFVQNEEERRFIQKLPPHPRQPFAKKFPHGHPDGIDLVEKMLTFDPTRRITVEEAIAHPYLALAGLHDIDDEPICHEPFSLEFERQSLTEEQMKEMIYREALEFNPDYVIP